MLLHMLSTVPDLGLRKPEEALEAYGEAGWQGSEPAGREQDPGHERGPVQGIVPDRQRRAGAAEEDPPVGYPASQPRTSSRRSSENPDVPTTTSRSCSTHQCRLDMTTPGWVKSTTRSHPVSASSASPWSTSAATSRSGASLTVLTTSRPIRPRAPSTPTLAMAASRFRSDDRVQLPPSRGG